MHKCRLILVLSVLVLGAPLRAQAQADTLADQKSDPHNTICQLIQSAAQANALPLDFFARLIWQESHFQPDVIGPLTSRGERAQGIAQFMPGTAMERRLYEPFNPVEALPKSGEFLAELREQFGNLGLAAAAYNAGPQRVRDYLSGLRDLPTETRNYVLAITRHPIEDWLKPKSQISSEAFADGSQADHGATNCRGLVALLDQMHSSYVSESQMRNFPSWCKYLRSPNVSECGPVREGLAVRTSSSMKGRSRGILHALRTSSR
jgi:hypothetical protein